jgi:hypothetical protein
MESYMKECEEEEENVIFFALLRLRIGFPSTSQLSPVNREKKLRRSLSLSLACSRVQTLRNPSSGFCMIS